MTRSLMVATCVLVGTAVACSSGPTPSAQDREALAASVAAARSAASAHDADGARRELAIMRATLEAQLRDGSMSAEEAAEIDAAADDVEQLLDTVTTTTTIPPPVLIPDESAGGKGKGNAKEKGKGAKK
jgi:hypothetical protein